MKLCLQYTSNIDKKYIKEASKLVSEEDAIKRKWQFIGVGVYKASYKKGNIVVKFNLSSDDNMHMLRELLLYKEAPAKYKKYLARIFGGNGRKMIQGFVYHNSEHMYTEKEMNKIDEVAFALGIGDTEAGHNVVKAKDNRILFYDFGGHSLENV